MRAPRTRRKAKLKSCVFSVFLGEALVGNEAVDQLVKFNAAMADHSSEENPHLIDGIVLTKFDTIDDKVSAISSFAAFELKNIYCACKRRYKIRASLLNSLLWR